MTTANTTRVPETDPAVSAPSPTPALIASDIDGTLLVTGQPPSAPVLEAVGAVRHAGHHLVLSTGRSLSGALAAARELGVREGTVIASNGSVIADLAAGSYRLIEVHGVDARAVVRLVTMTRPDLRIAVEIVGVGYHVNMPFPTGELNGDQVTVTRPGDLWAEPSPRVALHADGAGLLVPALRAAGFTAIATRSDWVDVTVRNVSKATAAERVRRNLGIPIECTVAIGDGENDIELLRWAWRGVSMGHASAQVQAAADEVTGTIAEMGAVRALRSLLTTSRPADLDRRSSVTPPDAPASPRSRVRPPGRPRDSARNS